MQKAGWCLLKIKVAASDELVVNNKNNLLILLRKKERHAKQLTWIKGSVDVRIFRLSLRIFQGKKLNVSLELRVR